MSSAPLGRTWMEALALARAQGALPYRIRLTRPPRACAGRGALRVVGVRPRPSGEEWILAYEEAVRPRDLDLPSTPR